MIDRRLIIGSGLAGLTLAACAPTAAPDRDPLADLDGKLRADDLAVLAQLTKRGQGLPAKGSFCGLLYNEPSQCLVVAMQRRFDALQWTEDLYYRHRSAAEYREIPGSSNEIHYNDAISAASVPKVFFNVTRWNENGGDWASISSFDLVTSELRTELTEANLRDQDSERVWVSSLISVRDDASSLFCSVAFEERLTSSATIVHYWLCEIRLTDFALTRLSPLPDVFA